MVNLISNITSINLLLKVTENSSMCDLNNNININIEPNKMCKLEYIPVEPYEGSQATSKISPKNMIGSHQHKAGMRKKKHNVYHYI